MDTITLIIYRVLNYLQKVNNDRISMAEFGLKTRERRIVFARQLAMYFYVRYEIASLAKIGAECGGKDHATVLHAKKTINNLYDTDQSVRRIVDDLDEEIVRIVNLKAGASERYSHILIPVVIKTVCYPLTSNYRSRVNWRSKVFGAVNCRSIKYCNQSIARNK